MRPKASPNYLAGYPAELTQQIKTLLDQGKVGNMLLKSYPVAHEIRTDKALYAYVSQQKNQYMGKVGQLSKVRFDSRMHIIKNALGMHTSKSVVQGGKLKAKREIHVAAMFKTMPSEFLRMIVVHELAHMKELDHNKSFYQLCRHMEPEYHQFEFDVRVYLTYLDAGGLPLWVTTECV